MPSRALLVEDNAIIALNTEELLLEIGVSEVIVAGSVKDALRHCDEHLFDFALLDLNLGSETSIAIASRLQEAGVAFAFASGVGDRDLLPAALGHCPILQKPYLIDDLRQAIHRAFRPG